MARKMGCRFGARKHGHCPARKEALPMKKCKYGNTKRGTCRKIARLRAKK